MIVQLSPDAPLLVRAAAASVLFTHIGGASLGLVSGTISMLARKGGWLHRKAGTVFFAAMLAMGGAGAIAAPFIPDRISAMMGVFVFYLALTAWLAVQGPAGRVGRIAAMAGLLAIGVALADVSLGVIGSAAPGGVLDGEPSQLGFVFGLVAGLAALADLRVIRAGGLTGPARLRRHLWRMSAALAIAWGSFAGQPKAQPEALHGSPLLALPAVTVLGLMIFWLVRTRAPRGRRRQAVLTTPAEALS